MKTYQLHWCARSHRTYQTFARCVWRRAVWVRGEGPYAVLAHCRSLTIALYADLEDAEYAKRLIDRTACGGRCTGDHEIIRIDAGITR
jgi:hypothetical protein